MPPAVTLKSARLARYKAVEPPPLFTVMVVKVPLRDTWVTSGNTSLVRVPGYMLDPGLAAAAQQGAGGKQTGEGIGGFRNDGPGE